MMSDVKTMAKVRVYFVISLLTVFTLVGMSNVASSLPAYELPPLYIIGTVISPSIVQLLITIGGLVVTVMLIRYTVIALHGHSVVKKLLCILVLLAYLFLMFFFLMRAGLTYTTYSELHSSDESSCAVIYSEFVTIKDHHSGILYVVDKSGGIGSDTGYRWAAGHDSLPDIAILRWDNGVGSIEPWDVLEPTSNRPAQITCT